MEQINLESFYEKANFVEKKIQGTAKIAKKISEEGGNATKLLIRIKRTKGIALSLEEGRHALDTRLAQWLTSVDPDSVSKAVENGRTAKIVA